MLHLTISRFHLQVCERSLTNSTGGPTGPPSASFVRAEMLPSGFLIRPCEGGGSIIHIVDHVDLDVREYLITICPLTLVYLIALLSAFMCLGLERS